MGLIRISWSLHFRTSSYTSRKLKTSLVHQIVEEFPIVDRIVVKQNINEFQQRNCDFKERNFTLSINFPQPHIFLEVYFEDLLDIASYCILSTPSHCNN